MVSKTPWFERKFGNAQPDTLYPNIVERLRGTPARLEDRVKDLPQKILTHSMEGAWSIQENMGHLLDLESIWAGRLEDILSNETMLRHADLENKKTHEANHNNRDIRTILADFREARKSLTNRLDMLENADLTLTALHPRLKEPMGITDLIYFVAEHDDHHLSQVTEILKELGAV